MYKNGVVKGVRLFVKVDAFGLGLEGSIDADGGSATGGLWAFAVEEEVTAAPAAGASGGGQAGSSCLVLRALGPPAPSHGSGPCMVSVDRTGSALVVANYGVRDRFIFIYIYLAALSVPLASFRWCAHGGFSFHTCIFLFRVVRAATWPWWRSGPRTAASGGTPSSCTRTTCPKTTMPFRGGCGGGGGGGLAAGRHDRGRRGGPGQAWDEPGPQEQAGPGEGPGHGSPGAAGGGGRSPPPPPRARRAAAL